MIGSRLSVRSKAGGKPPLDKMSQPRSSIQDHLKTLDAYTKNADIDRVNIVEQELNSPQSMKPKGEPNPVSKSMAGQHRQSQGSVISSVKGADITSNKAKSQIRQSNEMDLLVIKN